MKIMFFLSIIVLILFSKSFQNVYYPDENGNVIYNDHVYKMNEPSDHTFRPVPPRGTVQYEKYVQNAISTGLMKLTLAVQNVFTGQSANNYDNVAFSPISISGSLALILLGADGKTHQEISALLGFATGVPNLDQKTHIVHEQFGQMIKKLEKTQSQVNFATAVFVQDHYPIKKLYKTTAENIYRSEIVNLNFEMSTAQEAINSWVSDRTNGKISKILNDPPPPDTKIVLASAMYFKAEWEHPFFEGATKRRLFYVNGKESPTNTYVDMMSNGGEFPYYKDRILNCEIVGFPYKGNQSTMYIVKPFNSSKSKLEILEKSLTVEHMNRLASSVTLKSAVVIFPRMVIDSTIDLSSPLRTIGISSLFDPLEANLALLSSGRSENVTTNENDDLLIFNRFGVEGNNNSKNGNNSKIIVRQKRSEKSPNPGLYANKVVHKVYMHITETGTEAAASTAFGLSKHGSRLVFRAEEPFIFFVMHEETRILTFWGKVNRPTPFYSNE